MFWAFALTTRVRKSQLEDEQKWAIKQLIVLTEHTSTEIHRSSMEVITSKLKTNVYRKGFVGSYLQNVQKNM